MVIMSGFSKYIPVTEEEYKRFKQEQQKQILLTQQELQQSPSEVTLSSTQNEKTRKLFEPTSNSDLQEKRFKELVHMVNELKRQITTSTPVPIERPALGRLQTKADKFLSHLGPEVWNEKDELVYNNEVFPHSSKKLLTEYAVSNWKTKFNKPPIGSKPLQQLILDKNVPSTVLGRGVQRVNNDPLKVSKTTQSRKRKLEQVEEFLSDSHKFRKLMRSI